MAKQVRYFAQIVDHLNREFSPKKSEAVMAKALMIRFPIKQKQALPALLGRYLTQLLFEAAAYNHYPFLFCFL